MLASFGELKAAWKGSGFGHVGMPRSLRQEINYRNRASISIPSPLLCLPSQSQGDTLCPCSVNVNEIWKTSQFAVPKSREYNIGQPEPKQYYPITLVLLQHLSYQLSAVIRSWGSFSQIQGLFVVLTFSEIPSRQSPLMHDGI